jgi:hypothetical protein
MMDGEMPPERPLVPTIFLTGPVGSGKTTTAWEICDLLENFGIPHALVDIDNIRWCFVPGSEDRYNTAIAMANLKVIWQNYHDVGVTHLILAGVLESRKELAHYSEAVPGAEIQVFRLRVQPATLKQRVLEREHGIGQERRLHRAIELAEQMDQSRVEDYLVQAEGRSRLDVAREILSRSGWLGERQAHNAPGGMGASTR